MQPHNRIYSIKKWTLFMNSEKSKVSKLHVLKLKLTSKLLDLRLLPYQILVFATHGEYKEFIH